MKLPQKIPILLFLFGGTFFPSFVNAGIVSDSLMSKLHSEGNCDAILELNPVLSSVLSNPVLNFLTREERTSKILNLVQEATDLLQAPFLAAINKLGFSENVEAFWIANKIAIKDVDLKFIHAVSAHPGTFTLRLPATVSLVTPVPSDDVNVTNIKDLSTPEWGVRKIEAPALWKKGILGKGVIVAGIDTGVLITHVDLKDNFQRGGWKDAVHNKNKEPYDDNGHGTHTMGTMVGQNGIGVAPEATWIACKALNGQGSGTETQLMACAQFVLKFKPRPAVVSNSWAAGEGNTFFNNEIKMWQAAGIIPVFAIGNNGPACSTAGSPGDQPNVISVGATDEQDKIAYFSGRGDKEKATFKPEVSAPGVNVRSAYNGGPDSYRTLQGTSMATPHVAGAVALMLCGNPCLKFNEILKNLEETAVQQTLTAEDLKCGAPNGDGQNNVYGYGRINVREAMHYEKEP